LLCTVMQIALEPAALGIAGFDDARAGGGQLLVGVGVRECLCDQLRKVAQLLLDTLRERLVGPSRCGEGSPEPSVRGDRGRHCRSVAGALHRFGEASAGVLVSLNSLWAAAAEHSRDDRVAVQIDRAGQREGEHTVLAPAPYDRGRTSAVVAQYA